MDTCRNAVGWLERHLRIKDKVTRGDEMVLLADGGKHECRFEECGPLPETDSRPRAERDVCVSLCLRTRVTPPAWPPRVWIVPEPVVAVDPPRDEVGTCSGTEAMAVKGDVARRCSRNREHRWILAQRLVDDSFGHGQVTDIGKRWRVTTENII